MTQGRSQHKLKKEIKLYSIDQSLLYRSSSHRKLADSLKVSLQDLRYLLASNDNYKVFDLEQKTCQYTGKVTKARTVQEPKTRLRAVHERMKYLLQRINPPRYAHAAIKGRSYRSNAYAHRSSDVVATLDIKKFYPSTLSAHVFNFFRESLLCQADIAKSLTDLVCYQNGLPTGSPLSPLLSLYANMPLFDELNAYAQEKNLIFTCYVDDIAFSGSAIPVDIKYQIRRIVKKYHHNIAENKVKVFRSNYPKHITGVVIDHGVLKVPNSRFMKLRAMYKYYRTLNDSNERVVVMRGIAGLLGEAAYLDARYQRLANIAYDELRLVKSLSK